MGSLLAFAPVGAKASPPRAETPFRHADSRNSVSSPQLRGELFDRILNADAAFPTDDWEREDSFISE